MGRMKKGILSGYSGIVGNIKGYRAKGQDIIQHQSKSGIASVNSFLKQNSLNVAEIANVIKKCKPGIIRCLEELGNEDLFDWNTIVQSTVNDFDQATPYYVSSITFVARDLPSLPTFSRVATSGNVFIRQDLSISRQFFMRFGQTKIRAMRFIVPQGFSISDEFIVNSITDTYTLSVNAPEGDQYGVQCLALTTWPDDIPYLYGIACTIPI